jgi:hypothetical protein
MKSQPRQNLVGAVVPFAMAALLTGCAKNELDREMSALCLVDGGVKVYEQQILPPREFDSNGHKRRYYAGEKTDREAILGPDYRYVESFTTVAGSRGSEWKGHVFKAMLRVYRRSDNKLLGESTSYSRVGGDGASTLWHWQPSSSSCPEPRVDLLVSLFSPAK